MQLKGNHIPRGLIPLEKLFDQNYVAKDPRMKPIEYFVEYKNIGAEDHLNIIKLSKNLFTKTKEYYVSLMKKYTDVFAWSYEDLKEHDTSIIEHTIPINPSEKPFKQKLRRANLLLMQLFPQKNYIF